MSDLEVSLISKDVDMRLGVDASLDLTVGGPDDLPVVGLELHSSLRALVHLQGSEHDHGGLAVQLERIESLRERRGQHGLQQSGDARAVAKLEEHQRTLGAASVNPTVHLHALRSEIAHLADLDLHNNNKTDQRNQHN